MIGLKLYSVPKNSEDFFEKIKSINVDALFISKEVYSSKDFIFTLKKRKINFYCIFQVFYNPSYLKANPSAYSITERGERAIDEWVQFVCPSDNNYKEYLIGEVAYITEHIKPTGISLDFIRQFIFWEKVHDVSSKRLIKSCKCPRCRDKSPSKEITNTVKLLTSFIKKSQPDCIIGLHSVPWKEGEFNNSLLEIAGQDLNKLGSYVDFISPMCYSHMLKKEPNWINQVVKDHKKQSQISVIPAVQVKECYLTDKLTKNNLKKIIKESIKKPSGGIILWSWDYIEDSEIYNWLNIEFRDLFLDI